MACFQIPRTGLFPFFPFESIHGRKSSWCCSDSDFLANRKVVFRLQKRWSSRFSIGRRLQVYCRTLEGDNDSSDEEPPESLFMKELKKRGMTPTSLLEDSNRSLNGPGGDEVMLESSGSLPKRNGVVSTDFEKSLSNQRERSMALNSEGLEGLIPRAKLLLTIGGTFFIGFWPLILVTVAFFSALYLYFGPSFLHDASKMPMTQPTDVDPYQLLEDKRLSESAPRVS